MPSIVLIRHSMFNTTNSRYCSDAARVMLFRRCLRQPPAAPPPQRRYASLLPRHAAAAVRLLPTPLPMLID